MNVLEFDIKWGIFHFEIGELETRKHAHPVF